MGGGCRISAASAVAGATASVPIDLPRTERQKLALDLVSQRHAGPETGQPLRQRRVQQLSAQIVERLPRLRQYTHHCLTVMGVRRATRPLAGPNRQRLVQQPDCILAVIGTDCGAFVQNRPFLGQPRPPVAGYYSSANTPAWIVAPSRWSPSSLPWSAPCGRGGEDWQMTQRLVPGYDFRGRNTFS